jgi:hypothetical protein
MALAGFSARTGAGFAWSNQCDVIGAMRGWPGKNVGMNQRGRMTKEGECGEMRKVKDIADKLILRLGADVCESVTLIRTQSNRGLGMQARYEAVTRPAGGETVPVRSTCAPARNEQVRILAPLDIDVLFPKVSAGLGGQKP